MGPGDLHPEPPGISTSCAKNLPAPLTRGFHLKLNLYHISANIQLQVNCRIRKSNPLAVRGLLLFVRKKNQIRERAAARLQLATELQPMARLPSALAGVYLRSQPSAAKFCLRLLLL